MAAARPLLRAPLLALFLPILSCSFGDAAPQSPPAPWSVSVSRVGSPDPDDAPLRCSADGAACSPLHTDDVVQAPSVLRAARGAGATLRISDTVTVDLANAAVIALREGDPASIDVREGTLTIRVESPDSSAPDLSVADTKVRVLQGVPGSVSVRAPAFSAGAVSVHTGVATATGSDGVSVELRSGETAWVSRGHAPDKRAGWAAQVSPVQPTPASEIGDVPITTGPRGLGRMTARVPGTEQVVSGVELVSHKANVVVRDGLARTEVEEEFRNGTDRVLEGRYVFPLPPRASISRLALWVGDRLVEGEIVERKRAATIFKGIVDDTVRPRDPALLEWVAGSEFSLKVFPIPPHGSRRVVLAYNEVLSSSGGQWTYSHPLSLGADRATRIGELVLNLSVRDAVLPPAESVSVSYPAQTTQQQDAIGVRFDAKSFSPARDFVASWPAPASESAAVSLDVPGPSAGGTPELEERSDGEAESGWFALRLRAVAPSDGNVEPLTSLRRAVVLDKSASQGKESWDAQARLALSIVSHLTPDESFVVLACDTACTSFPREGLSQAKREAIAELDPWLKGISPGGASDPAGAIAEGARRLDPGPTRAQLIYAGDGQATAGDLDAESAAASITDLIRDRAIDVRVVGAGRTVDEVALGNLARRVGATYEPLATGESLNASLEAIAMHARTPIVEAPAIELPASMTDIYPRVLPNLRLGEDVVIVGRASSATDGEAILRGRLSGAPYEAKKRLAWPEKQARNPLVPRLWAEARIAELSSSGAKDVVREVVGLSRHYHVMSRHTAMLVLESEQMFAEFGIRRTQSQRAPAPPTRSRGMAPSPAGDSFGVIDRPQPWTEPASPGLWGAPADDAFGAGGLGLSGVGEAGGGRGEGIGLGSLGTVGRGAGAGQGFGSGAGRLGGSHSTHPPRVRMGAAAVSGRLPPELIQRIVRQNYGRFRLCYENGLRSNYNLRGRVAVRFVIGRDGSVSNVGDAGSDIPDASVAECVRRSFYALSFPAPEGGIVTVVYPLVFRPSDDDSAPLPPVRPTGGGGFDSEVPSASHRAGSESWREQGEPYLARLRASVEKAGDSRKAHAALVRGLIATGRFDEALAAASRFVEIDPDSPVAWELLARAQVVVHEPEKAASSTATVVELAFSNASNQIRAARAYEAIDDETRACAHWRAAASLARDNSVAKLESIRCSARLLGGRDRSLADAKAAPNPDKRLLALLSALEKGDAPPYDATSEPPATFEVQVSCSTPGECPMPVVLDTTGKLYSPVTPSVSRANASLVSFPASGGEYRTLLVGGDPQASGKVRIQAMGVTRTFSFSHGGQQTVAASTVSQPSYRFGRLGSRW